MLKPQEEFSPQIICIPAALCVGLNTAWARVWGTVLYLSPVGTGSQTTWECWALLLLNLKIWNPICAFTLGASYCTACWCGAAKDAWCRVQREARLWSSVTVISWWECSQSTSIPVFWYSLLSAFSSWWHFIPLLSALHCFSPQSPGDEPFPAQQMSEPSSCIFLLFYLPALLLR